MVGDAEPADVWLDWFDHLQALESHALTLSPVLRSALPLVDAEGLDLVLNHQQTALQSASVGDTRGRYRYEGTSTLDRVTVRIVAVRDSRPFTMTEARRIDRLSHQLTTAIRRHALIDESRAAAVRFREALGRLPVGVLLVGSNLEVWLMTEEAARLATRDDFLRLIPPPRDVPGPEHLLLDDSRAMAELRNAMATLMADATLKEQIISVPRVEGRPYGLMVARLDGDLPEPGFMLLVSDPEAPTRIDPDALRRLYRLTPAESRLCTALANGKTLKTYAQSEGVSLETVRSQLKQAMVKTDTHKQAQLVRLLVTGPAAYASLAPKPR